jgi:hypothetical protein
LLLGIGLMAEESGGDGSGGGGGDDGGGDGDAIKPGDANQKKEEEGKGDDKGDDKPGDKGNIDREKAALIKENVQRKLALRELTEKNKALEARLGQFEGVDADEVKKLLDDKKKSEEAALEAKGDYERLKQRMAEEHNKEVKTLKEQVAALQTEVGKAQGLIGDLSVGAQFGQSRFVADNLVLTPAKARVIYGDYFDLDENGKVVGYDKPRKASDRTALVDSSGNPVAFDEALRRIVEADPEKDYLLKSQTKPGAGSGSHKKTGNVPDGKPPSALDRIAAGLKSLEKSS